ncbi:MHYT domain-containing protein [Luedemannella helvata]|uniref:MHYT domain-containing protein n=1 Tax=Luedemannella helvata TaxID=349315 RepID=A0ABN2K968_9ACTN
MVHLNQFSYGWLNPGLAYALSVLGSLLGLICTARARRALTNGERARWLLLAAWAIGGTGIWVMHFMAMLGFTVPGMPVRYDVPMTLASWITAVVVVALGLFIVGFGKPSVPKVLSAGILTGVGVAAMHYTGMGAMRMAGVVVYDRTLVIASVVIAVVAATVALFFTITLRNGLAIAAAAAIMGVAVCGMHYTGMFAMSVYRQAPTEPIKGLTPVSFIAPIVVFVLLVSISLFYALLNRPLDDMEHTDPGGPPAPPLVPATPDAFTPSSARAPRTPYVRSTR